MINNALLAFDGSDGARAALDMAIEICTKCDATLTIIHVLMHGRPAAELVRMAQAEHMVPETFGTVSPGLTYAAGKSHTLFSPTEDAAGTARVISSVGEQLVVQAKTQAEEMGVATVRTIVRNGDYAEEILAAADEGSADLIVMGSRGLGALRGAVLGSVSQKVLHHARPSVLAVR